MADLLADQLKLMASSVPEAVAFKDLDGGELSFQVWDRRSNQLARGLVDVGVVKGERVAIYLPTPEALDWVVSYAAVHRAGAVAVPTNTRLVAPEMLGVLGHAEPSVVITSPQLWAFLDEVLPGLPSVRLVAYTGGDHPAGEHPTPDHPPWRRLSELMTGPGDPIQIPVDDEDLADIMYTSGTTGRPKGVVVRHGNAALIPNGLPTWSGAGWLFSSPLFTFAGISSIYNPMKLGMTALYQPRFDAGQWLKSVEVERPLAVFLVPSMAKLLLAHPAFEHADLSSVLLCTVGGSPLAPDVQRRLQRKMPDAAVSNGYGMTEAGTAYCILPKEESERRMGSVGKPMAPVEFVIVDENGRTAPARAIGELVIRMPGRAREYFRDPSASAATWMSDGLHTGDLAYLDEDGYLYIVGRKKDVIIRGGNNVHAVDVETVLAEHPAVLDAAVAGIPHPVLGEDVAAWVVLQPGAEAGPDEISGFLRQRLADYKVPRRITIVDDLPRNATGKVVKSLLA